MLPMDWKEFAVKVFDIEDADPMYYSLSRTVMSTRQKKRFMAAWVTFYNPGIAAAASEHKHADFWRYLHVQYDTAKRASERRHFRGAQGMRALDSWTKQFPTPEDMIDHMVGKDYFEVKKNAKSVAQVGEYFVWKFADVQERVFKVPCHFPDEAAEHSPKVPQQGARLIDNTGDVLATYNMISAYLNARRMKSPPSYDRPMNMQEAETVCCVYKQYRHGKWLPYSRTAKATRSLLSVPSDTGREMLRALHVQTKIPYKEMDAWQADVLSKL